MSDKHILRITDGANTVELSDDIEIKLMAYEPQASLPGEPIQETFNVHLVASLQKNLDNIRAINRLFMQARNYRMTETGPRVYAEFDPGNTGTIWRSEIIDGGSVNPVAETLGIDYINKKFRLPITWTRQPFWEGPLTQLRLTNSSASNDLDGITVDNVNDGNGENFVDINAQDVDGDLYAPVKIEMYNSYSSADPADEIYIFHNVYSNPSSLTHVLEGEDATGGTVTPTAEGSPGSSDDNYAALAWTATTETLIATWAITSVQLSYMAGGRFGIVARFNAAFPYTDCFLRLKLESGTAVLWEGEQRLVKPDGRELYWLDTVRLPPYLAGQSDLRGLNLTLYGYRNQAGEHTFDLDYLMLSPISGDNGWKRFLSIDAGVDYEEYFYHDATERFDYRVDTSGDKVAEFTSYGGPIMLVPNEDQRLYFLSSDNQGLALVLQTWTVKMWYRPRRNTL